MKKTFPQERKESMITSVFAPHFHTPLLPKSNFLVYDSLQGKGYVLNLNQEYYHMEIYLQISRDPNLMVPVTFYTLILPPYIINQLATDKLQGTFPNDVFV